MIARTLLVGANGRTGRAVLRAFRPSGHAVRVLIRDPSQAAPLAQLGAAEHAVGDLLRPDTIEHATAGCTSVIYIGPPMHPQEVQMASNCLRAASDCGVRHFVYYSVLQPQRREIRHHRLKLEVEQQVIESGLPYTIVQPARYMQHLETIIAEVAKTRVHAMPFNIDVEFSVVDLRDVAEAVAIVTENARHGYATYELAGPEKLSQTAMAAILSEVAGTPIIAEARPIEQLISAARRAGASDDRVEQMVLMNQHYDHHGMIGNGNVLEWILGRSATRFRSYCSDLVKRMDPKFG